ncbi:MAG: signal recognition particle-docking protein FtsY [Thermoprotei archaeon]|nr:MAG: signal recognition particle-docking protein FtsY [Thermoprotei archaeon]
MFLGRIRKALTTFANRLAEAVKYRELSEKDVSPYLDDLLLNLVEADVAYDAAELLVNTLRQKLIGVKVPRGAKVETYILQRIREALLEILRRGEPSFDIDAEVRRSKPYILMFMGVNGVGKTTTIAKFAYRYKKMGLRVMVVAADTFRAAAQEQLKKHSSTIGVEFFGGKYGSDPAAVAHDAINYSRKRGFDLVLLDTAGRMHVDVDLMEELRKVVRVAKPNMKILVVDALTGNDAVEQARTFHKSVGVDGVVLTKVDADARGGAALSVILTITRPILFLGVGQRYEDLVPYSAEYVLNNILRL